MDRIIDIQRKGGVATVKFLSGDVLRIPSAVYLERRVRTGDSIDPAAYRLYMAQRSYPHALECAVKFLALRERSEKEVQNRLKRSCYDDATIQKVMDTLQLHDLVSDQRFAGQWVESRSKKYGRTRIAQELRMKGLDSAKTQLALAALPEEEEQAQALRQAQKMARRFQYDAKKIAQALVRRGYGFSMAKGAAEEACREKD